MELEQKKTMLKFMELEAGDAGLKAVGPLVSDASCSFAGCGAWT